MRQPLSVIDFATVRKNQTVGESFADSVTLAQEAERHGYTRVWYAEHHNMPTIASSAPAVLISHIASKTESIRLAPAA
nr:LLM class flavin-dependent oxidoreductase [Kocuria atrinae]